MKCFEFHVATAQREFFCFSFEWSASLNLLYISGIHFLISLTTVTEENRSDVAHFKP